MPDGLPPTLLPSLPLSLPSSLGSTGTSLQWASRPKIRPSSGFTNALPPRGSSPTTGRLGREGERKGGREGGREGAIEGRKRKEGKERETKSHYIYLFISTVSSLQIRPFRRLRRGLSLPSTPSSLSLTLPLTLPFLHPSLPPSLPFFRYVHFVDSDAGSPPEHPFNLTTYENFLFDHDLLIAQPAITKV